VRTYGTYAFDIMGQAASVQDLGYRFAGTLYEREVEYLIKHEWAITSEDILWRRTKQGLYATAEDVLELDKYLASKSSPQPQTAALHHSA
jgi:glycerol-3-phosphate dehydrogenase